jgi:hypothetical protein
VTPRLLAAGQEMFTTYCCVPRNRWFPENRVLGISGRQNRSTAHGSSDMPLWRRCRWSVLKMSERYDSSRRLRCSRCSNLRAPRADEEQRRPEARRGEFLARCDMAVSGDVPSPRQTRAMVAKLQFSAERLEVRDRMEAFKLTFFRQVFGPPQAIQSCGPLPTGDGVKIRCGRDGTEANVLHPDSAHQLDRRGLPSERRRICH